MTFSIRQFGKNWKAHFFHAQNVCGLWFLHRETLYVIDNKVWIPFACQENDVEKKPCLHTVCIAWSIMKKNENISAVFLVYHLLFPNKNFKRGSFVCFKRIYSMHNWEWGARNFNPIKTNPIFFLPFALVKKSSLLSYEKLRNAVIQLDH
jgi:hypothetical protein